MVEVGRIEDWTIIVCSRDAEPVIITIPSQHTVLQLKEQIEKEMSIPVSEQKALYYQEKPLLDDRQGSLQDFCNWWYVLLQLVVQCNFLSIF